MTRAAELLQGSWALPQAARNSRYEPRNFRGSAVGSTVQFLGARRNWVRSPQFTSKPESEKHPPHPGSPRHNILDPTTSLRAAKALAASI